MSLAPLLDGTDDRALVDALADALRRERRCTINRFYSAGSTCNEVERTAFTVWESCAMVSSGGFLYLIENEVDFLECASSYERIGLNEVASVVRDVAQLIPERFKDQQYDDIGEDFAGWMEDKTVYNQFRELDRRYFKLTAGDSVANAIASYLRDHRDQLTA